jgi:putative hydrolase
MCENSAVTLEIRQKRRAFRIKYMGRSIQDIEVNTSSRSQHPLDNGMIAVLLERESETASGHLGLALKRAARNALLWPEEASDLLVKGRSLTELQGVGRHLSRLIVKWIESPSIARPANELQQEFLTLARARRVLAKNSQWRKNLKGDLHMHTTWSDGSGSVAEMAGAAVERGYRYIGITDHTKGLKIAGGIDEARLLKQGKEINLVNSELARQGVQLTVLRSAEVNLSRSGEVDVEPVALDGLDIVLGSFHSALRKSEDQTDRFIMALRNSKIQILGHPQGRVYNHRQGLSADWSRVFAEAAHLDKAVEIDGYADRQDLRLSLLKIARKEGVRISLGTDSHHVWQFLYMDFCLAAACLAKIPPDRIINFMPLSELRAWVRLARQS